MSNNDHDREALPAHQAIAHQRFKIVFIVLLIVFSVILLVRGPATNPTPVADFAHFYTAARAWVQGENPYLHETSLRIINEAPGSPSRADSRDEDWPRTRLIALYPPATFPLLSPLAALPYQVAALTWTVLNVLLVPLLIVLAGRLAEVRLMSFQGLLLATCIVALAPLQTTFRVGQMSLLITAMVLAALVLMQHQWSRSAGLMLGLTAALKPQIGLVFLAYALIRRRWWAAGVGVGVLLACQGIGMAVLSAHGHDWWQGLRDNLRFFNHGGPGDPTSANPHGWQLINLHRPLHLLIESRLMVQAIVWTFTCAVGLLAWRLASVQQTAERERIFLAIIVALTLLVAYHRVYDAVLLVIPLTWLVRWGGRRRWVGWTMGVLLLPFVVSGPAALQQAASRGWIPEAIETSPLWSTVILAHQTWVLVALALVLLGALAWSARRPVATSAAS